MSQRTISVLLLALISGLSAVVGVSRIIGPSGPATGGETVKVVVATQDLDLGDAVPATALTSRDFPKDLAHAEAIADEAEAADRVVLVPITKGEPILKTKLAPRGVRPGLADLVPVGKRAVCIRINDVAAGQAGLIVPKNRVDVLFTATNLGPNDPSGGGASATLLQDVEILAVDREIYYSSGDQKAQTQDLRSVTLLVTPEDAPLVELAQNTGTLHLSLRNPEDKTTTSPRVARSSDLPYWLGRPVPDPERGAGSAPPSGADQLLRVLTLRGQAVGTVFFPR